MTYIPKECWTIVFSFLSLDELISLSLVSKLFNTISREEELWKNLYEIYNSSNWKYLNPRTHCLFEDDDINANDQKLLNDRKRLPFYEQFKLMYR